MVESPSVNRLLDIVSQVEKPEESLGRGGDDLGPSTGPGHCYHSALRVHHNRRAHRAHRPLARGDEVVPGGGNIVGTGDVGGGEVVHLNKFSVSELNIHTIHS